MLQSIDMNMSFIDKRNSTACNRGLNARQAEVLNSTFVLSIGFGTKLNILLSNPALRQAPKR